MNLRYALRTSLRAGATFLLIAVLGAAPSLGERTVAIGDIHGALRSFSTILLEAGLTDEKGDWTGGKSRLVQTGDFTDRGSEVRKVMDLLIELQAQARAAGGKVTVLLGNHEVLNLMRHVADVMVNPRIYGSFADEHSPERRAEAMEAWKSWWRETAEDRGASSAEPTELDVEEWLKLRPLGFVEYHEAFAPRGRYGAWLRRLPVVHRIRDTIFLHGGVSSEFTRLTLEQINRLHRDEIEALDETRARLEKKRAIPPLFTWGETMAELDRQLASATGQRERKLAQESRDRLDHFVYITASENSPLWFRGFAQPPHGLEDESLAVLLDKLVSAYGARHYVSAHSPFSGGEIAVRLGGAFFVIDTGMLQSVYGGRPSALEISDAGFVALYPGQRQMLVAMGSSDADARHTGANAAARPAIYSRTLPPRFVFASQSYSDVRESESEPGPWKAPPRRFLDRDGQPAFSSPEEVEEFLRQATVLKQEPLTVGKTGAKRLELEHNGRRARAVFHTIDDRRSPAGGGGAVHMSGGKTMLRFRDSYTGQVATYHLARLMGMDLVPPAVIRNVGRDKGSVALWIEGGTNLTDWRESHSGQPAERYFRQQFYDMRTFDALINNKDRNTGNIFWTPDMNMWFIDHTRTFAQDNNLYKPDFVQRCSRDLLRRIRELDEDEMRQRLEPYLSVFEIRAIFKRRQRLLKYLEDRMRKLGEDRVLFDYGPIKKRPAPVSADADAS